MAIAVSVIPYLHVGSIVDLTIERGPFFSGEKFTEERLQVISM